MNVRSIEVFDLTYPAMPNRIWKLLQWNLCWNHLIIDEKWYIVSDIFLISRNSSIKTVGYFEQRNMYVIFQRAFVDMGEQQLFHPHQSHIFKISLNISRVVDVCVLFQIICMDQDMSRLFIPYVASLLEIFHSQNFILDKTHCLCLYGLPNLCKLLVVLRYATYFIRKRFIWTRCFGI